MLHQPILETAQATAPAPYLVSLIHHGAPRYTSWNPFAPVERAPADVDNWTFATKAEAIDHLRSLERLSNDRMHFGVVNGPSGMLAAFGDPNPPHLFGPFDTRSAMERVFSRIVRSGQRVVVGVSA